MGVRPGVRQGIAVRGPLETHAAGLAAHLAELEYQRGSIQRHLRMMGRLSQWMEERGLVPGELTDEAVAPFAEMMRAAGSSRMSVCGLASALSFLRGQGVIPAVALRWSGHAELLEDYRVHLARERGLAAGTVENKLRVAREFLDEAGGGAGELRELTAARMLEILTLLARRRAGYGSAVTTASFVRALLRFLFATGRVAADLAPAIPRVSSAGASGSARGRLPPGTVARLLQGCDRSREAGLRDYAILLLLARLGLRSGEIAAIDFGDIGWADGTLLVHGKGGRRDILPLPGDVGEAIARYLCSRPPVPGCRAVFITARVPRHAIGRGTVGALVGYACGRAHVGRCGPHRLRHALASDLLAAGAPLTEIAAVLRHDDLDSTAIYATAGESVLTALALPWPARESPW
jgi:site-specific recombinase XerD